MVHVNVELMAGQALGQADELDAQQLRRVSLGYGTRGTDIPTQQRWFSLGAAFQVCPRPVINVKTTPRGGYYRHGNDHEPC